MCRNIILSSLLMLPMLVNGYLNVFISQAEVMKLLGLDAELYYVRDGVVNTYAMNFIVPVSAYISDLEFMWQSLGKRPIPYVMSIDYESRGAMLPPQVNITERGLIPTSVQTFRIRLPCTGIKSAEIEVHIQLNISCPERGSQHHDTRLNFKRNKICLKGLATPMNAQNESRTSSDQSHTNSTDGTGVIYIAAGCVAIGVMLVTTAGALSTFYVKGKNKAQHDSIHTSYTTAAYGSHQNVLLRLDTFGRPPSATGSYATIASIHKFPFGRRSPSPYATTQLDHDTGIHIYAKPESRASYYAASNITHISQNTNKEPNYIDPIEQLRHLSTARYNIKLEMLLQEGTFGQIYKGVYKYRDRYEEVIVKTVSDAASSIQSSILVAEGMRLSGLSHPSILSPAAVATDDPKHPLIAYCSPAHTQNLKRFLTSCRLGVHATPTTRELVDACVQASRGLAFLHAQKMLHMDVAARNCVVDEKLHLKLTDSALSRDLFPEDYHCLGDNENRPVKWMSPEALVNNQYSTSSDVWSLGVLIWECVSVCEVPLRDIDASDVASCLTAGYRLHQPHSCPDHLYSIMTWCWSESTSVRPSAARVLAALHDFYDALSSFV